MKIFFNKVIQVSHWIEDGLMVAILSLLIGLAITQILLRNLFDSSLLWADPVIRISVLWIALLGATIGTRKGEHIAIDVLSHYIKGVWRIWMQRLVSLVVLLVSVLMTWVSWTLVMYEKNEWFTPAFGEVPVWPFQVIIPVAFGYIALRSLVHIYTGEDTQ